MTGKSIAPPGEPPGGATKPPKPERSRDDTVATIVKGIGGSANAKFNRQIAEAVLGAAWLPGSASPESRDTTLAAVITGLRAFEPTDEIEGMIAVQAMAMHFSVMELSRCAMIPEQPFEIAQGMRKSAANMSRTFTELLAALDRKRGKGGQQKVTVEHVHVHAGGKAIVGAVGPSAPAGGGGGGEGTAREQPRASPAALEHDATLGAVLPPLRGAHPEREAVPIARHAERPLPHARRR